MNLAASYFKVQCIAVPLTTIICASYASFYMYGFCFMDRLPSLNSSLASTKRCICTRICKRHS
eukprot:scaffold1828_cov272-Chaetoceros_neogracile.AAC.25